MNNGCPNFRQTVKLSRRQALHVGTLTALGLGLPHLRAASGTGKANAVILLWLYGGPSHIDLFDPKPAAPSSVRSPFAPIAAAFPALWLTDEKLIHPNTS